MHTARIVGRTCGAALCLGALNRPVSGQQRAFGISYLVDTSTFTESALPAGADALRLWQAFGSFSARVSFAANRGRLELLRRRTGRPRAFFFEASRFDTVDLARFKDAASSRAINLYWHIDRAPYAGLQSEIARGAIATDSVPLGEFNVIQWFGASRALARLVERGDRLPPRVTLTTAVPLKTVDRADEVPPALIVKREFQDLERAEIPLISLTLPAGYSETPWAGEVESGRSGGTRVSVARWRTVPVPR